MKIEDLFVGKLCRPDHPATVANPNGRDGFIITEVRLEDGNLWFRGEDTIWFELGVTLEIKEAPKVTKEPPAKVGRVHSIDVRLLIDTSFMSEDEDESVYLDGIVDDLLVSHKRVHDSYSMLIDYTIGENTEGNFL